MRIAKGIRRGLPGLALAAAACGGSPEPVGPESPEPPPPVAETFHRDRPVFHVVDPARPCSYFVYSTSKGIVVMTVDPGLGLRPATETESRYTLERYEAHLARPRGRQADAYAELLRAERAAQRDISDELLALMEQTLQRWREEKRAMEIRLEAARAAGAKEEEGPLTALVQDLERRILAHEIKMNLYTSPEWKAARPVPKTDGLPLRAAGEH